MKKNCWEFKGCGRGPGGLKVPELGVCPAAEERRLNSVHGGTNAGRACWIVAGTLCNGHLQGTFAQKHENCYTCDFYKHVKEEEGRFYKFSIHLMKMISEGRTYNLPDFAGKI